MAERKRRDKPKRKTRTMDVILVVIAIFLLAFVSIMILLYYRTGGIPDTLCTCVFGVCGGECGIMGWIKTTKERQQDRKNELQDRYHNEILEQRQRNAAGMGD